MKSQKTMNGHSNPEEQEQSKRNNLPHLRQFDKAMVIKTVSRTKTDMWMSGTEQSTQK